MRRTRSNQVGRLSRRGGFTILELLVVIGIIVILIGILIPVVSKVRKSARAADTTNQISVIQGAIERYYSDFHAYPGPLSNSEIGVAMTITGVVPNGGGTITGSENLVLGLLGGLRNTGTGLEYNKDWVGQGAASLNVNQPRTYPAYISTDNLSDGAYSEGSTSANDTNIPEFLDRFSNTMPILYLRANVGMGGVIDTADDNAQYDLRDIIGYTGTNIGLGKSVKSTAYKNATYPNHGLRTVTTSASMDKASGSYTYPYDAYPYFTNPNQTTPLQARAKDGYILISAGPDRVYGTEDDITTFGSVVP